MRPAPRDRRRAAAIAAAAGWLVLIAVAHVWGDRVLTARALLRWPPFVAAFDPRLGAIVLPALAVAIAVVAWWPAVDRRLGWPGVLLATAIVAAAWAVALALIDGTHALTGQLALHTEFLTQVRKVGPAPGAFVRGFVSQGLRSGVYSNAVRGHPPGFLLLLWALARLGVRGVGAEAAIVVAAGVSAVPAVLIAAREVAGEAWARRAAPFLAAAPFAVTLATTPDAFFLGVAAWGVALFVLATGRHDRAGDALALGAGLVLGAGLMLSYGLVPSLLVPVAVAGARRRIRPVVLATAGVAVVLGAFAAAGFWWLSGLLRTRGIYVRGVARFRPYAYFLVADLAAFAVIVGPATAAGLARLRDRRAWVLVGGAIAAVLLADVSGLSKAEVERIWLPFAPWAMLACAALTVDPRPATSARPSRAWLAASVATGLAWAVLFRSPW